MTIHQQIINFIDAAEFVTFSQVKKNFAGDQVALLAFEDLLADGQIRQVVDNKLFGTYKYCLAV